MKEFQEHVSTPPMSDPVVFIKIYLLVCLMIFINGPRNLEIVLMRPRSFSPTIVSGLGERRVSELFQPRMR